MTASADAASLASRHLPSEDGGVPDAPYLAALGPMPPSLVFIMGCHRSGTTLLYHLLSGSGQFNVVTAYDVLKYDELLRNRVEGLEGDVKDALDREIRAKQSDRLVDRLPVGAELPEEYRFVLAQEVDKPLRQMKNLIFSPHLTPETKDRFQELCRKKQYLSPASRPLLLKNPSDFYRNFEVVHRMFPDAKFIFLHRHPLQILNSLVVNWHLAFRQQSHYLSLLDRQYAELFEAPPIARFITRAVLTSRLGCGALLSGLIDGLNHYLAHIGDLPAEHNVAIRYEDFCREPDLTLGRIGRFLQVDLRSSVPEDVIKPRHQPVLPVVRRCYARRARRLTDYLSHMGYPV